MVADQAFDTGVRAGFMHALDGLGPDCGATIRQVVAVNTGDDDMSQSHEGNGFCDTTGLVVVDFSGSARLDVAKATRSGAGVPQDHDGGRPAVPAFAHVWTGRFFADRVQSMRVHDFTESLIAGPPGTRARSQSGLRPRWSCWVSLLLSTMPLRATWTPRRSLAVSPPRGLGWRANVRSWADLLTMGTSYPHKTW